ncbi:hypothetical protein RSSM_03270 [Rhodopirellula sallentina SM41]|uniref:Uncharacterized protein n=1 Tax=Rhodopirellula sallentina SM41 TaxID=1263870 RepID=M5UBM0_9BACT|nr:hypothetical protein RSSM_03270 [Rhodopirellula sallentina SM41]
MHRRREFHVDDCWLDDRSENGCSEYVDFASWVRMTAIAIWLGEQDCAERVT